MSYTEQRAAELGIQETDLLTYPMPIRDKLRLAVRTIKDLHTVFRHLADGPLQEYPILQESIKANAALIIADKKQLIRVYVAEDHYIYYRKTFAIVLEEGVLIRYSLYEDLR